jgi:hypothetical protein
LSIVKRTTKWLSGAASLELQSSTGTNSSAEQAYLLAAFGEDYDPTANLESLKRSPLIWDKPWAASINADFTVGDRDRPVVFGWRMPPNWSLNFLWQGEAGQRYTPLTYVGPNDYLKSDYNSATGSVKSSVNLRFNKYWEFGRRQRLTFSLEVRNLFNHKNYRRINPFTGTGYQLGDYNPGWTDTPGNDMGTYSYEYATEVVDPSYIEDPLTTLWGVSYSW